MAGAPPRGPVERRAQELMDKYFKEGPHPAPARGRRMSQSERRKQALIDRIHEAAGERDWHRR
eukprot:740439-Lingulodinium_polyedra.AAC.1